MTLHDALNDGNMESLNTRYHRRLMTDDTTVTDDVPDRYKKAV
jgi:hypothetical protein